MIEFIVLVNSKRRRVVLHCAIRGHVNATPRRCRRLPRRGLRSSNCSRIPYLLRTTVPVSTDERGEIKLRYKVNSVARETQRNPPEWWLQEPGRHRKSRLSLVTVPRLSASCYSLLSPVLALLVSAWHKQAEDDPRVIQLISASCATRAPVRSNARRPFMTEEQLTSRPVKWRRPCSASVTWRKSAHLSTPASGWSCVATRYWPSKGHKVGKHFITTITDNSFSFARDLENITTEENWTGCTSCAPTWSRSCSTPSRR